MPKAWALTDQSWCGLLMARAWLSFRNRASVPQISSAADAVLPPPPPGLLFLCAPADSELQCLSLSLPEDISQDSGNLLSYAHRGPDGGGGTALIP